jgi:predicted phosphodiesterase
VTRTLIISDLHIGSRAGHCVLERSEPLEALLAQIDAADRLVLLGDVVELYGVAARTAIETATPILRAIGARIGAGRQIVLVPGNHDRPMIREWIRSQGRGLEIDARVPVTAGPLLERVCALLGPAPVEVRYPSVWLDDGVWATHGHYLNRHLVPISTWGLLQGGRRRTLARGSGPASIGVPAQALPSDYERRGGPHRRPAERRPPSSLGAALGRLAGFARAVAIPHVGRQVLRPALAPVTSRLLGMQVWRHGLPALERVADRLGVEAETIVFGHVHRAGPLADDEPDRWRGARGRPRFLNSGSWLYTPQLVSRAHPPNPYWPGGAVVLDDAGARAVGLLDDLGPELLRRRGDRERASTRRPVNR